MTFPDRFPFDVLDPAPWYCGVCGCELEESRPQTACQSPAECECHAEWRDSTDDLEKRWLWGDK